jgi:hypothetical protein
MASNLSLHSPELFASGSSFDPPYSALRVSQTITLPNQSLPPETASKGEMKQSQTIASTHRLKAYANPFLRPTFINPHIVVTLPLRRYTLRDAFDLC